MKKKLFTILFIALIGGSALYYLVFPSPPIQNVETQHAVKNPAVGTFNEANGNESQVENLNHELAKTKFELKKLQTAYDKLKSQMELEAKHSAERKNNVLKSLNTEGKIERRKKRWANTTHNAARELAEFLNLTNVQLSGLKKLLESKTFQDIDVLSAKTDLNEKHMKIDENLANFRADIHNLLDNEQIQKYEEFEFNKAKEFNLRRLELKRNSVISKIPNLSEEQKTYIGDFYEIRNIPSDFGAIGVYGTAYEPYKYNVRLMKWFQNELKEIKYDINSILNSEQHDAFNK